MGGVAVRSSSARNAASAPAADPQEAERQSWRARGDAIRAEIEAQYGLHLVGKVGDVRDSFYAISVERRLTHPGVLAISRSARSELLR